MGKKETSNYAVPSICSNVLVVDGSRRYQGKVTAHAKDSYGNVTYVFVERDSTWRSSRWEYVHDVFTVAE